MDEESRVFVIKSENHPVQVPRDIVKDKKIDFYTLGVYTKLLMLLEDGTNTVEIYSYGKGEFITKAITKLVENNYIEVEQCKEN